MSFLAAAPALGVVGSTGAIGSTLALSAGSAFVPTAIGATASSLFSPSLLFSVGSTILGAGQSMSQASNQNAMYRLQAMQTQAESARKALAYEQRANETLRRLNANNAATVARGYGGGILGLEGSSKLITTVNTREAGRDFMTDISNASNALMAGSAQADIFGTAGNIAARGGLFDAAGKLATGAYEFSKIYKTSETPKETPKG
jgi:hypothetical protein